MTCDRPFIVSRAQFAVLVGMSPAWVSKKMDQGMPAKRPDTPGEEAEIDLAEALPWLFAQMAPSSRERLAQEQADKVALENAVRRRALIPADYHDSAMQALASAVTQQLEALPGRLAGEFADPATGRSRVQDEVRSVRAELAAVVRKFPSGVVEAARTANGEDDGEPAGSAEEAAAGQVG